MIKNVKPFGKLQSGGIVYKICLQSVPTGILEIVDGTPFDFRDGKSLNETLQTDLVDLLQDKGLNHTFVLPLQRSNNLQPIATLFCPDTNIQLKVATSEPGLHVYCANYFDGSIVGKQGTTYPNIAEYV